MPPDKPNSPAETNGEAGPVSRAQVYFFGLYLILLNIVLLYLLVHIWPPTAPKGGNSAPDEISYLIIVILAGALGSYVHLATSFADYVGNRQLVRSWLWWYILRPFIGMSLAVLVYFALRAGLVTITTTETGVTSLNLYVVASIAGLSGMFSRQAADKLGQIFDAAFGKIQRKNALQRDTQQKPEA